MSTATAAPKVSRAREKVRDSVMYHTALSVPFIQMAATMDSTVMTVCAASRGTFALAMASSFTKAQPAPNSRGSKISTYSIFLLLS